MKFYVREPIPKSADAELSSYPELVRHLLYHRGIRESGVASAFLNPDFDRHSHDPFLMKGMREAVERILSALERKEKIVIWGDYDADGVPGGVLLHDFFKKLGYELFSNYVPHRHDEGFGLNHAAIEGFVKDGVKLIITVDCGIADGEEVARAKELGLDTIITDHHEQNDVLPDAVAILDPKQKGCAYPFKELCGAGVAFKLVQALLHKLQETSNNLQLTLPSVGWEKWLLDMVGIATLSDMVPLVGENRVFAHYGLLVLKKSPRPGIQKLLRKAGVNQRMLNEDDIAFSVTPKLNAASRLGSADVAFRLLATHDEVEADSAVDELMHLNNERKGLVGSLVKEIKKIVAERYKNPSVIVVGNPAWRPALLGLAANTLAQEHACPVFLWGRDGDDVLKGSSRSDGRVNLMTMMAAASGAFIGYGGHAFSGGFSIESEKIHSLEETLAHAREKMEVTDVPDGAGLADWRLSPDEVNLDTFRLVSQLSPFGHGNLKPVFFLESAQVRSARRFGKEGNHLEVQLSRKNGGSVKAIQFFTTAEPPPDGSAISFLANLEQSSFGGRTELRLRIVDML